MCAQLKDPLFFSKPRLISVYNSGFLYRTDPHRCLVHCARDVSLQKCTFCSFFQQWCDRFPPTSLSQLKHTTTWTQWETVCWFISFFWSCKAFWATVMCSFGSMDIRPASSVLTFVFCFEDQWIRCEKLISAAALTTVQHMLLKFLDLCWALPLIHSFFGRKKKTKKHQN